MDGKQARQQHGDMTFEEAARLDPDRHPGEVEAGRWIPLTKNTYRHGQIVFNVCAVIRDYARRHPGWTASAGDPGTKVAHAPDTLRGPDVAVLRKDRFPTGKGAEGWLDGAPEVAIEIVGDAQSVTELVKKAVEFLQAGARAVWILDPEPQRVLVITPASQPRVIEADGVLDGEDALPGFSCKVAEFFED